MPPDRWWRLMRAVSSDCGVILVPDWITWPSGIQRLDEKTTSSGGQSSGSRKGTPIPCRWPTSGVLRWCSPSPFGGDASGSEGLWITSCSSRNVTLISAMARRTRSGCWRMARRFSDRMPKRRGSVASNLSREQMGRSQRHGERQIAQYGQSSRPMHRTKKVSFKSDVSII